jgi:hypothetical protein
VTRATLVVYSNPSDPAREEEYNSWYDKVHVPEVLTIEGFVAATRFRVAEASIAGEEVPHRYLALYEVESDDLQGTLNALVAATPNLHMSDAIQMDPPPAVVLFEQVSERVVEGQRAGATSVG